jgi:hypothetical protein
MSRPRKPQKPQDSLTFPRVKLDFQATTNLVPGPKISVPPPRDSGSMKPPAPPEIISSAPPPPLAEIISSAPPPAQPSAEAAPSSAELEVPTATHPAVVPARRRPSKWGYAVMAVALLGAAGLVALRFSSDRGTRAKAVVGPTMASVPGTFVESLDVATFQRGNIHTHSTRSDGHQSPAEVAEWYRSHGYQFLVLSEHNVFADPDELKEDGPGFVLIGGEEITAHGAGEGVHVNALCIDRLIPAVDAADPPRPSGTREKRAACRW